MSPEQFEKAFRYHYGEVVTNNSGEILINGLPPSAEDLANASTWYAQALAADRAKAILARAQAVKNASLGKTPEQLAETLKTQVNMGISGLFTRQNQVRSALRTLLVGKGVCSFEEFADALTNALTPDEHAFVNKCLLYWDWVQQVDAHAAALIANPNLTENFPPAPTL